MARVIDSGHPQHAPTAKQQTVLLALMEAHGLSAARMRHKKTGEWHTIMMLVRPPTYPGESVHTFGIARVFEDKELDTYVDEYELPDGTEMVRNPDHGKIGI